MRIKSLLVIAVLSTAVFAFTGEARAAWCYNFNTNFEILNYTSIQGPDVKALITALRMQGYDYSQYLKRGQISSALALKEALAVFQTKNGIVPSGNVDSSTRAKLNSLYRCKLETASLSVIGNKSVYEAGSTIKFSVKAVASGQHG